MVWRPTSRSNTHQVIRQPKRCRVRNPRQGAAVSINVVEFDIPFIVFLGDAVDAAYAKTALGLVEWRADACGGQMRLPGCRVDAGVPDLSIAEAKKAGASSLIIGSAAVGGGMPAHWIGALREAAAAGIDIIAGLHVRLASFPG